MHETFLHYPFFISYTLTATNEALESGGLGPGSVQASWKGRCAMRRKCERSVAALADSTSRGDVQRD